MAISLVMRLHSDPTQDAGRQHRANQSTDRDAHDVGVKERAAAAFAKMGFTVLNAMCIQLTRTAPHVLRVYPSGSNEIFRSCDPCADRSLNSFQYTHSGQRLIRDK
jgi:hypothetical protein